MVALPDNTPVMEDCDAVTAPAEAVNTTFAPPASSCPVPPVTSRFPVDDMLRSPPVVRKVPEFFRSAVRTFMLPVAETVVPAPAATEPEAPLPCSTRLPATAKLLETLRVFAAA